MQNLKDWYKKNGLYPLLVYFVVCLSIELILLFYTVQDHRDLLSKRINSQVENIISLGLTQNNREVLETSLAIIVDDLGAKSVVLCDGKKDLFSYPHKAMSCLDNPPLHFYESLITRKVPGFDFDLRVQFNLVLFPFEYLSIYLISFFFILTGFLIISQILRKFHLDIINPVMDPQFVEKKQKIREIEGFRENLLEKRELEIEKRAANLRIKISEQVAHDIKSPLGSLDAAIRAFQSHPDRVLALLNKVSERIKGIVWDLDQGDVGQSQWLVDESKLRSEIEQFAFAKNAEYYQKSFSLNYQVASFSGQIYIPLSKHEIFRIMSNLVNNSIEAIQSNNQKVILSASLRGDILRLTCSDNGRGVDPDHIDRIFERGYSSHKLGNSGLGLYDAKNRIERVGGSIKITDSSTRGTTFEICIKVKV